MITVTTPSLCVALPDRILPDQPLTAAEADVLETIRTLRMKWYVNYWLSQGMSRNETQAHLLAFAQSYKLSAKPTTEIRDPVFLEASAIARKLVLTRLLERGIELDAKSVELHVAEVAKLPKVTAKAQEIVKKRQEIARNLLLAIEQ